MTDGVYYTSFRDTQVILELSAIPLSDTLFGDIISQGCANPISRLPHHHVQARRARAFLQIDSSSHVSTECDVSASVRRHSLN